MGINRTDRSLRIADLISRQKAEGLSTDEQNELDSLLNKEPALQHLMDEFQAHHQVYKELELMNSFDPEVKLGDYQKRFYNRRKKKRRFAKFSGKLSLPAKRNLQTVVRQRVCI